MKNNIIGILLLFGFVNCKSQTLSLRPTSYEIIEGSYEKDINNELSAYTGTWIGTWNNKKISITFKKITNHYDSSLKYYKDYLVGKFKVIDNIGNVLFDNSTVIDNDAKINGINFRRYNTKYSLVYIDKDLCGITGDIAINFTDSTKTKLQWTYSKDNDWIDTDCFYWGKPASERPDPLPHNIVLSRQNSVKEPPVVIVPKK